MLCLMELRCYADHLSKWFHKARHQTRNLVVRLSQAIISLTLGGLPLSPAKVYHPARPQRLASGAVISPSQESFRQDCPDVVGQGGMFISLARAMYV
jgi:hypothetical protein